MGWIGETIDSIKSLQIRHVLSQAVSLGMIVTSALIIWKGLMCITGSESPVVVVLSGSMEPGFKRGDILFLHMSKDPIRVGEIVVFNVDGREIPIVHRVIKVTQETSLAIHEDSTNTIKNIRINSVPLRFVQYPNDISDSLSSLHAQIRLIRKLNSTVDGLAMSAVGWVLLVVHERQDTGEVDVLTKGDNNFGDDRLLYAHGQLWLHRHHIMGRAVGFLPYVGWVTIIMTEKPIIKYLLIGALGLLVVTSKD